jgi:hypothetical protein
MINTKEKEIVISGSHHEDTGWERWIQFTYKEQSYQLTLYWNSCDGYDIYWRSPTDTPEWVVNWNENEHQDKSLANYLDELTQNND